MLHGTIIFTDQLVRLAEHREELRSILLHEIGHVYHRHGLRSVIQSSLFAFMLAMATGDASATAELFLGAPLVLSELAYSRKFEYEADAFARDYMVEEGIPLEHFHRIMERLALGPDRDESEERGLHKPEQTWSRYLSTHPPTSDRIERFRVPEP